MIVYPDEMFAVVHWKKGNGEVLELFLDKGIATSARTRVKAGLERRAVVEVIRVMVRIEDARYKDVFSL